MKKLFMLLMAAGVAMSAAVAQDTLHMRDMRLMENYYVPEWPDTFRYDDKGYYYCDWSQVIGWSQWQAEECAWRMYTEDTLQVYGIAISLSSQFLFNGGSGFYGGDTSHEQSYEWVRLYEAKSDGLEQLGEDLYVHLLYTPVSYYVDMDLWYHNQLSRLPLIPMYELYFSEPHAVADTFYIGRRYGPLDYEDHPGTSVLLTAVANNITFREDNIAAYLNYTWSSTGNHYEGWRYHKSSNDNSYLFMFPILTPQDTADVDTTGVMGDTAAWRAIEGCVERDSNDWIHKLDVDPAVVARYVQVTPNPATGVVKVVSSFGLQGIEAYNESGVKVCSEKASGLMHKMDVSSWPKGMYVLKIGTDMGTTMKRLVVQ